MNKATGTIMVMARDTISMTVTHFVPIAVAILAFHLAFDELSLSKEMTDSGISYRIHCSC
jgi:hypothetical protein